MKANLITVVNLLTTLAIMLLQPNSAAACTCMPQHPQTSYCTSEYVVLVRVIRKSVKRIDDNDVYKVEIKRSYKMSPKVREQLKDGRLITPTMDSMCGGLNLKVGKLYLVAGNGAKVGICNYAKEYSQMTIVERRGFAGGYKKGCSCEVRPMFQIEGFHHSIGSCSWQPFAKCEGPFGACIPTRGLMTADGKPIKCHWRNSLPYVACQTENSKGTHTSIP